MKELSKAIFLLRLTGILTSAFGVLMISVLSHDEHLSYFSYLLFDHQEMIKTGAIFLIFLGVFYLFFCSQKAPSGYLKIKLFKGSMKAHPEIIKDCLEKFLNGEKLNALKIHQVSVKKGNHVQLELSTSNLQHALHNLEDVEAKLKVFMESQLGIKGPLEVQLYEV
jgi:hypothetical protein